MALSGDVWLLDTSVLTTLAGVARSDWAWPASTLHVTAIIAFEAWGPGSMADPPVTPRQRLLRFETAGGRWIAVHHLPADSDAGDYLVDRLGTLTGKRFHDGEAEAIAWCACVEPAAVFVTQDKTAAFVALSELGPGRVALPFDLWAWLLSKGLIDDAIFERLCGETFSGLKDRLPGVPARIERRPSR